MDFLKIRVSRSASKRSNEEKIVIYPTFIINNNSKDLMVRGGDFYAVWDETVGLWRTDEDSVTRQVDAALLKYKEEHGLENAHVKLMEDSDSGSIDKWHKYVQRQLRDNYHDLDKKLIFANEEISKDDYATKKLPYNLEEGSIKAYEEMISTLYAPDERQKIEWAIGSIVNGDSKKIQKFVVLYGEGGTGKSTVLDIVEMLFPGYCSTFSSKSIGSATDQFALEPFKMNPLVAIDHDGNLSRIEDNTRLNKIVSHEKMVINEKHKSQYTMKFNSFLFVGSNEPVRITNSRSGIIRRLIDASPTGNTLPEEKYFYLKDQIKFELGAIAYHCKKVYESNKHLYDKYIPIGMMGATNDVYNFLVDRYLEYKERDRIPMSEIWLAYDKYCTDYKVPYPMSRRVLKEELKGYFQKFQDKSYIDGVQVRDVFSGIRSKKLGFDVVNAVSEAASKINTWLVFDKTVSLFDVLYKNSPAQYANEEGRPTCKWENCKTKLMNLDTNKLHYVMPLDPNHIVIDFDIKNADGEKDLALNLEAANKWPETYAELSKSGKGIHLHYIYNGDVNRLSRIYDDEKNVEIKVFNGKSSLRRMLTKCNDKQIATLNSGLPMKGETKMLSLDTIKSERTLRKFIQNCLDKKHHGATKPEMDFIYKKLEECYDSGLVYDVSDMRSKILSFAMDSTNQADYCVKLLGKMKLTSEEPSENVMMECDDDRVVFYDVEVFPNLFVVVWKYAGEDQQPVIWINPSPTLIEDLAKKKLVGFNCRRYDNHIIYARLMGYTNQQLFNLSQRIINNHDGFIREAYNLSYTDIYDFTSKKQSLKKWEIELGIHHQELGLPWDKPVDADKWKLVGEYCVNDVVATEAVWNARQEDWVTREVLSDLSGLSVNSTTRMHATKFIFGNDKNPPLEYTDLSEMFPGYTFDISKPNDQRSWYRNEYVGEGGYVYSEPGMYENVALLDIASMHPTSIIRLNLFGHYTKRFEEILNARLAIKHKQYDKAAEMLNGALKPYLDDTSNAGALAQALKIVINSVYGYTTATFSNPFKDPRNVDNIVAKRGALFMVDLKHAVQEKGFTVAHIKTDSIKIPDATPEIIDFVMEFGKKYGYNFEHEATYSRMCLVNDAVYIAQYADGKNKGKWTATGAQFQVPYVFKTLFSHDPIVFEDLCETKTVTTALYLDMNEDLEQLTVDELKELELLDKAWNHEDIELQEKACKRYGYEMDELPERYVELCRKEVLSHNYIFVGRAGQFCPMLPGAGGGWLVREKDGRYHSATGAKDYRWMESEVVKRLNLESKINHNYYKELADKAVDTISEYGDFEAFTA